MSCTSSPAVICVNYGESVSITLTYLDDAGDAIDLTSATPAVFSSTPEIIIEEATFTVTDAAAGEARFFLDRTSALSLRMGRNNRFRLQMIFGEESDDVTPDIFIQVT
jgi:hypothetical protein